MFERNRGMAYALLVGTLSLVLSAGALWGQDGGVAGPPSASLFGDIIDVRVVNLEVVVTRNGERVSGLQPEDFELTIDGEDVPIEYFTEVLGGTAVQSGTESQAGTLPALAPGAPVSTSYLVFIDEFFMLPSMRNMVLKGMIEQLPMLDPEDRMAVVAFNGKKLEMLSSWSQSIPELTRVFEDALERPAYGLQRRAEERSFESGREFRERRLLQSVANPTYRLDIEEEQEAQRIAGQVKRAVMSATSALRGFANPPGRKVMVLFSGGWPYNPAQWVVGDFTRSIQETGIPQGEQLYGPLIETANRLSYTIYPVEAPYLRFPGGSAEVSSVERSTQANTLFNAREQESRAALNVIAGDTGGRAIFGGGRSSALENAVTDTRTYYWIGFTPDWKGDDEEHDIRLKARDRKLKVRSRESFSDLSRSTEVTMMVESTLLLGDAPTGLPLYAQVGPGVKAKRGKVQVPLTVVIPIHELTFLPNENEYLAEIEMRIAVEDERGGLNEIPVIPMRVSLTEPPKEGDLRRVDTGVLMRKRKHTMVVSLYDVASGKILTAKLDVDPKVR